MKPITSTTIQGSPLTFNDFVKSLKKFDSIKFLKKMQEISISLKNQAYIRININFEFSSSPKIKHHILLTRHCISFLSKQIILNFNLNGKEPNDLDLINLIYQYDLLKCDLHEINYQSPEAWLWVLRASNLQFFYMRPPDSIVARYYYIFSYLKTHDIEFTNLLNEALDIDIIDVLKIGFYIYTISFISGIPLKDEYNVPHRYSKILSKKNIEKFINLFAADENIFSKSMENIKVRNNLLKKYEFNPLRRFPIFQTQSSDQKYFIPSIGDFIYSFSEGLYYVLIDKLDETNKRKFFNKIGSIFEIYIGDLLQNYNIDLLSRSKLFPEMEYKVGKNKWKTADWILVSPNYIVQVECKKNRPNQNSKIGINFKDKGINKLISDISKELDKLIKKENHIKNSFVKEIDYLQQKFVNIIVYLDEMYAINEYARKEIITKMEEKNLNFHVFGCYEFELLCQACRNKNIGVLEALLNFGAHEIYEIDYLKNVLRQFTDSL